ncbi:hypothetical protein VYU27_002160 [Nannochloropsis oceanica]
MECPHILPRLTKPKIMGTSFFTEHTPVHPQDVTCPIAVPGHELFTGVTPVQSSDGPPVASSSSSASSSSTFSSISSFSYAFSSASSFASSASTASASSSPFPSSSASASASASSSSSCY